MKPAPFRYRRPATQGEAVELLAAHPGAKVLAGGQSLVPLLSMRLASPDTLVDINALPDLAQVTVTAEGVRLGALARHSEVLGDPGVRAVQPLLSLALERVAHATIRNRGTCVGSLVHADPAAELPTVLALLGGSVDAVSVTGRRTIPAAELVVGPMESSLRHDELAVETFFPALAAGAGVAFDEVARRHGDFAQCGAAALVRLAADGQVAEARVGYLSVNDVPTVLDLAHALAEGPDAAGEQAAGALDPQDDIHASADYRRHLVRVLTARVLRAAVDHARERLAP